MEMEIFKWKNEIYKDYIKSGRTETSHFKLQSAINIVSVTILKLIGQFLSLFAMEKNIFHSSTISN